MLFAVVVTDVFSSDIDLVVFTERENTIQAGAAPHDSTCVHIAGITQQPYGARTQQIARNLTDAVDGFLREARHLIHHRDPLVTASSAEMPKAGGVETLKLPQRSSNLNAYSTRFAVSARRECLNRVIPLGKIHLRHIVSE